MKTSFTLLILICAIGSLQAGIQIDPEILYQGKPVRVTVDEPVDTILITYRPNSQVAKVEYLTSSVATTTFEWIPSNAGVVAMRANGSARTVSVRFKAISWSGIFVMALAGILLFGGAAYAFRLLMYGKPPEALDVDIEHRVDT